jgi:hypothetical protein
MRRAWLVGALMAASTATTGGLAAQQPPRLSQLIATFLADSGVPTRGLPFTVAEVLPARWESATPVTADPVAQREGYTMTRRGVVVITLGPRAGVPVALQLLGTANGLQRVLFGVETTQHELTERMVFDALRAEGMTLVPMRCDLEKEGASYGNVVYAAKVPGKTASGLWGMWQCPQDGCTLTLALLYRRADMERVECAAA